MSIGYVIKHTPGSGREENLNNLLTTLPEAVVIDQGTHFEKVIQAWECYNVNNKFHVVLEDDAIIPLDFKELVLKVMKKDKCINFYASPQNHPYYQRWMSKSKYGSYWAGHYSGSVGVGMDINLIPKVMEEFKKIIKYPDSRCDIRFRKAFQALNLQVLYTYPSIVQHNIKLSSVIQKIRNKHRKAYVYIDDINKDKREKIKWK